MQHFKIVCTGWRYRDFIERCIDSISNQSYRAFSTVVVVDEEKGSKIINVELHNWTMISGAGGDFYSNGGKYGYTDIDCISCCFNKSRLGKVANFIKGVLMLHPSDDDIILDVDLDDYLEPGALYAVAAEYDKNPDLLLTYGSYRMVSGKPALFNGEYKSDKFRQVRWKASHLKSFKYKLYKQIAAKSMKGKDNRWLMTCADVAMMFPMLEMAGLDRIKHIKECLYCYNDLNPLNDHKVAKSEQERTMKYLRSLTPYKRAKF